MAWDRNKTGLIRYLTVLDAQRSLFSFWDRFFGSFRMREDPHTLRIGLDEFNRPEDHTLTGLLATPLKRVQSAPGEAPANTS